MVAIHLRDGERGPLGAYVAAAQGIKQGEHAPVDGVSRHVGRVFDWSEWDVFLWFYEFWHGSCGVKC